VYGEDAAALSKLIEAQVSDCPLCGARLHVPCDSEPPPHREEGGGDWCLVRWSQTTV
jgi:hypothetical protein